MRRRTRSGSPAVIPTSSMADIAFLLIVFFMVTTTFGSQRGIDFRLPRDPPSSDPEEAQPLEASLVWVDAGGRITVDGHPMNPEEIAGYLAPKLEAIPEKYVILQVDGEAAYGDMIDVLDELRRTPGLENIVIPSRAEVSAWEDLL